MEFKREKESVSASQLLQAIADGDDIVLTNCTVTGLLDINRLFDPSEKFQTEKLRVNQEGDIKTLVIAQSIVFDKCLFEENVIFAAPWSDPDSVSVVFESDTVFNSSIFQSQGRFRNATFKGIGSFDGCSFSSVITFRNACFEKEAKFRTVHFSGYCLFSSAEFKTSARFTNSHFVKGVNFSGARFCSQTDFNGVYASSRSVPAYESVSFGRKRFGDDESFWRFVKQSAQEAGYYRLAGDCFYNERCASLWYKFTGLNYEGLSPLKKVLRLVSSIRLLPELLLGRLLFGYGERPMRVLFACGVIIIFCALFFSLPGALIYRQGQAELSFFQGLYFSTITFTTLGYGDLYPSTEGFYRHLAMTEAIAGGFLMALFVVCLAKRFSRG
ncbi:MAG: potassium channel family protein [Planctomycetes bacterium]|nr:potassium channel family protein [Planctomycetota bacterium]